MALPIPSASAAAIAAHRATGAGAGRDRIERSQFPYKREFTEIFFPILDKNHTDQWLARRIPVVRTGILLAMIGN
jgi:hypothetical protein